MFHFFVMLGTSLVAVQTLILVFWILYVLVRRNVSMIDIGWGLGFIIATLVYFILGEGYIWRKALVLTVVSIWALRLISHLVQRFVPDRDDPRYVALLRTLPYAHYPLFQVLLLFLFQGLLITILSLPFALMSQDPMPFFSTFEVFGLLIWMVGVVGEAAADRQLTQFKQRSFHVSEVCDHGLWRYSRHPNYFFEWVVWVGFCMMALSAPFGWLSIISPILMLYLLLKGSGIPLTEARALQTKGEAYRDYQARTSAFFPWFSLNKSPRLEEKQDEKIQKEPDISSHIQPPKDIS
jgi:steroid 5-alpha reductase family enzyme